MGFIGQTISNEITGASKAPKEAARIQAQASDRAIAEERRQFDITRADQAPWLDAGRRALARLEDPNAFTASPGYEFVRREGMRDIGNSFAARGGAFSGNALRALEEFNRNRASLEYGNWWNREAGLAGVGQASANVLADAGSRSSGRIGEYIRDAGDSRASGIVNTAAIRQQQFQNGMNNTAQWFGYMRGR